MGSFFFILSIHKILLLLPECMGLVWIDFII
jgi:hypothetical protein